MLSFAFRTQVTEVSCLVDIGDVTSVDVRIDGSDGWLLASLTVVNVSASNDAAVTFECNCWLDDGVNVTQGSAASRTLVRGTFSVCVSDDA